LKGRSWGNSAKKKNEPRKEPKEMPLKQHGNVLAKQGKKVGHAEKARADLGKENGFGVEGRRGVQKAQGVERTTNQKLRRKGS